MAYKIPSTKLKEKSVVGMTFATEKELNDYMQGKGKYKEKGKPTIKETKYDIYSDPAHAWMKVKLSELKRLGIADKITPYSYQRGKYVYLEEDNDLNLFVNAKLKEGEKVTYREHIGDKSSKIRAYSPYKYQTETEEKETEELRQQILNSPSHDWSEKAKKKIKNASREDLLYWKKQNLV